MLKIENLSFSYKKSSPVLSDISLQLCGGEIGVLLGKNGSGKTTLFNNILGILSPKSGNITFSGANLLKMSRRDRAKLIGYVSQDIHFGALTVFDSVLMGRISHFGVKPSVADLEATEKILADM